MLLGPALATLMIGTWDLGRPSYWQDEAATLDADSRSLPALLHMLTNVDAVHGAYYLLMWPILHTFGTAEVVLRLPSLLAMTGAAAGVAALGRRLDSPRAGLLAGLVFGVLPQVSRYGQEARSYALVLACAVLASYLLIRAVREPGRHWLIGYGCTVAVLGLLNLFGLVLLAAHAVFLRARHRPEMRRWLAAATLGCLPAAPIIVVAWEQRSQLGWLTPAGFGAPGALTVWLAGSAGSVALVTVLIERAVRARSGTDTAWLALSWLAVPPVLLMIVSVVAVPVYTQRYVVFCLPALALLTGAGLARIALVPCVSALLLIAGLGLPAQLSERQPSGHGDDIRGAAAVLAQHDRRGDGVLYDCPPCHDPDMPGEFAFAYPAAFGSLRNLALAESPAASGTLRGTTAGPAVLALRLDKSSRVWLVDMNSTSVPAPLAHSGLRLAAVYPAGDLRVSLYTR